MSEPWEQAMRLPLDHLFKKAWLGHGGKEQEPAGLEQPTLTCNSRKASPPQDGVLSSCPAQIPPGASINPNSMGSGTCRCEKWPKIPSWSAMDKPCHSKQQAARVTGLLNNALIHDPARIDLPKGNLMTGKTSVSAKRYWQKSRVLLSISDCGSLNGGTEVQNFVICTVPCNRHINQGNSRVSSVREKEENGNGNRSGNGKE
ncbi:hypothetical protein BTVI_24443 [Pitangus sulphuratus]|nr:hypothetical protein BTVI_24443 [Pitangus sulphuratus]